ncbi:MAG: mechanosensitive ion channel [Bdellovibrionales bacterium]|nr:mechanosensitive ion channel [Bdellovibrionales bacterium]
MEKEFGWVLDIVNYPLFTLEGHPVSLSNFLFGIALLILGYVLSNRGSRAFEQRVLSHLSMEDHLRYTLRRFVYYFLLMLSVLFTLRTLHVPLTVFTVIGGALAVGIGFGSQNLVNNFISGILVMVERPIRVGDFMEVDGIAGRVVAIGIRSTQVRTGPGALVTIPNTTFIEKNLINWTLSGTLSSAVRFGVAYGTDVRRLRELCLAELSEVSQVVKMPPPDFSFVDFGDNALVFDLSYSVIATAFPARKAIESEIRYRLNDLFTKHRIALPFPQRDIHLRAPEAIAVRVEI